MSLSLIIAMTDEGLIGNGSGLPWHLPKDMERFKKLTDGKTVIMGRRTWESLPDEYRPLPNRENIVVTRNEDYKYNPVAKGATVVNSINCIFHLTEGKDCFVVGGAEIVAELYDYIDKAYITIVHGKPQGNIYLDENIVDDLLDSSDSWEVTSSEWHPGEDFGFSYDFVNFERKNKLDTQLDIFNVVLIREETGKYITLKRCGSYDLTDHLGLAHQFTDISEAKRFLDESKDQTLSVVVGHLCDFEFIDVK